MQRWIRLPLLPLLLLLLELACLFWRHAWVAPRRRVAATRTH
jgi:hypothetical protein